MALTFDLIFNLYSFLQLFVENKILKGTTLGRDVIKFIYKFFKVGYQITLMLIILTLLLNKNAANAELRMDKF